MDSDTCGCKDRDHALHGKRLGKESDYKTIELLFAISNSGKIIIQSKILRFSPFPPPPLPSPLRIILIFVIIVFKLRHFQSLQKIILLGFLIISSRVPKGPYTTMVVSDWTERITKQLKIIGRGQWRED